jgi:hypothetical protein
MNAILERHWEFAERLSKAAQTVLPRSRVSDLLTERYGGLSGSNLVVSKTWSKVWQKY